MAKDYPDRCLQIRSLLKEDQTLELFLEEVDVPRPGPGEVLLRV